MPLIEGHLGDFLSVQRLFIEYTSVSKKIFRIDSEPVIGLEYDIAAYIDSIILNLESNQKNSHQYIEAVLYRILKLSRDNNIKIKYFKDDGVIYNPKNIDIEKFEKVSKISPKNELIEAIKSKNLKSFIRLINLPGEKLIVENFGLKEEDLLHYCAEKGWSKAVELLVKKNINVNSSGKDMETPLVRASQNGHIEVVNLLLVNGAKVDGNKEGVTTPLIAAAASGHLDVVKILVNNGADKEKKDKSLGQTAKEIAGYLFHKNIVEYLSK